MNHPQFILVDPQTNQTIYGSKPQFDNKKEAEIEASWLHHLYGWSVVVAKKFAFSK